MAKDFVDRFVLTNLDYMLTGNFECVNEFADEFCEKHREYIDEDWWVIIVHGFLTTDWDLITTYVRGVVDRDGDDMALALFN